jgi:integrase
MREELVSRNVAKLVQPPAPQHSEIQPWTEEQARDFLKAAASHRLYALFVEAIGLGLRRGELLGLRWSDVGLDARRLQVGQTLTRVRGQGIVFGPPKTKRSHRILPLPTLAVDALRRHRHLQAADRTAASDRWVDTRLAFTADSGRHVEPRNLNTPFHRLLARSNVARIRSTTSATPAPLSC